MDEKGGHCSCTSSSVAAQAAGHRNLCLCLCHRNGQSGGGWYGAAVRVASQIRENGCMLSEHSKRAKEVGVTSLSHRDRALRPVVPRPSLRMGPLYHAPGPLRAVEPPRGGVAGSRGQGASAPVRVLLLASPPPSRDRGVAEAEGNSRPLWLTGGYATVCAEGGCHLTKSIGSHLAALRPLGMGMNLVVEPCLGSYWC